MNAILEQINSTGKIFVEFALPMLVQSSVLILILLLTDFALRKKTRAVFRYGIWLLVLIKLVLPTSLSAPLSLGYFFGDGLAYVDIAQIAEEPHVTVVEPTPASVPPFIDLTNIETYRQTPTVPPIIPETEPAVTEPINSPVVSVTPVTWRGGVFLAWLTVVMAMGLLLLQRAFFVRGLVTQAKDANGLMADTLESCRGSMRVKRKIGLKVSANATSPAVCGLFRPVILVPQNLTSSLSKSQLRAVLLHELAHIRRSDLWVNLAQTILQIIYFYNPLLWLANCMIRRVREQAVDEMVLVAMGEAARQYPQTLVNVAKLAFKRPALSLRLIGVVESKSALAGRIKHILNRPMPKKAKLGILGLAVVIIIAAILLPMATCTPGPPSLVIKGTVKDAQTGEPIAGARVFDDGYGPKPNWEQIKADERSEWGAITNSASEYSFLTWPEHHSIKVQAPGYKAKRRSLYSGHFVFNKKDEEIFDFTLEPEKVSDSSEFKTTLPNGLTVELIGVCEHPSEGKQWWRPDGSSLPQAPYESREGQPIENSDEQTNRLVEFAVSFAGRHLLYTGVSYQVAGSIHTSGTGGAHPTPEGTIKSVACEISKSRDITEVRLGITAGQWKTITEYDGGRGGFVGPNDIIFSDPIETQRGTTIAVRGEWGGEGARRITAVDKNGNTHTGGWNGRSTGLKTLATTKFYNVKPEQIQKYQLQFCPYEWVEFKNVSLKPNFKTSVEVEGAGGKTAKSYRKRYFATLVMTDDGVVFKGQKLTWEQVQEKLKTVPDRQITALEVAVDPAIVPDNLRGSAMLRRISQSAGFQKAAQLHQELGFEYISNVGVDRVSSRRGPVSVRFEDTLRFGEQIPVALMSFEEQPLLRTTSIEFEKAGADIRAVIKAAVTSYPKKSWEIGVRLLDGQGRQITSVVETFKNSGLAVGYPVHTQEEMNFSFGQAADLANAKRFEVKLRQFTNKLAAGKTAMQVEAEIDWVIEDYGQTRLLSQKEIIETDNWVSVVASGVKNNGRYLVPDSGLTLKGLIKAAGYNRDKLAESYVELIRRSRQGNITAHSIYSRNLKTLLSGEESDIVIKPHDAVVGGYIEASANGVEFWSGYHFSEVVELTVNDDGAKINMFADLDTGKLITPPDTLNNRDENAVFRWIKNNGIDVMGETADSVRGLAGFNMFAARVDNYFWDADPVEFTDRLKIKVNDPVLLSVENLLPVTYLIKTTEHKMGILQILGFAERPKGIKIRYKLLNKEAAPKTDVQVEVEKQQSSSVRGKVTDIKLPFTFTIYTLTPEGKSQPGVKVRCVHPRPERADPIVDMVSESDENGVATFTITKADLITDWIYWFSLADENYVGSPKVGITPDEENWTFKVLPAEEFELQVVGDKRPVPDAKIYLHVDYNKGEDWDPKRFRAYANTRSDSTGRAKIRFVKDKVDIGIAANGYASRTIRGVRLSSGKPYLIKLTRGKEITGQVKDPNNNSLESVTITAKKKELFHYEDEFILKATTDENGKFTLKDASSGEWEVTARLEDPTKPYFIAPVTMKVRRWWPIRTIKMVAREGFRLKGRYVTNYKINIKDDGGLPYIWGWVSKPSRAQLQLRTKQDGTFDVWGFPCEGKGSIEFVGVGGYHNFIKMPDEYSYFKIFGNRLNFENVPPGTYENVEVHYLLAGQVSGTVVDAMGHPFPGAEVDVRPQGGIHKTDKEGKFSIRIPPVDNVTLTVRDLKTRAIVFRSEPFNVKEGEVIEKNIKTRYKRGS